MIERDKQRDDQLKKHAAEKERRRHPEKHAPKQETREARSGTDPEAAHDEGYIQRMNEKTKKH